MASAKKTTTNETDSPIRQRSKRRRPNLEEVVDVTMELLLEHGEGGFRIEDLIARTGVSKSSLYLHFGSRDGLIAKACLEIFSQQVMANLEATIEAIEAIETTEDFRRVVPQIIDTVVEQRGSVRWNRVMVMAASRHRPDLWEELGKAQMRFNSALDEAVRGLQERGVVRPDLNAKEIALFVQYATFGRVFRDLDPTMGARDMDEWRALLYHLHFSFLTD
jgi:AcrR family transcriptional regulator